MISGQPVTDYEPSRATCCPVKHGLCESSAITEANAERYHLASECPAEQELRDRETAKNLQATVDATAALMGDIEAIERMAARRFQDHKHCQQDQTK
jgi:hypothetical protein